MWFRRAVYLAMFPAAVILPLWVMIARGIVSDTVSSVFVLFLFAGPVLFVLLVAASGLMRARKSVRTAHVLSWRDSAALVVTWLAIAVSGFYAVPLTAVIVVVFTIATFWLAAWELLTETRARLRTFVEGVTTVPSQSSYIPPTRAQTIIIEPHK